MAVVLYHLGVSASAEQADASIGTLVAFKELYSLAVDFVTRSQDLKAVGTHSSEQAGRVPTPSSHSTIMIPVSEIGALNQRMNDAGSAWIFAYM